MAGNHRTCDEALELGFAAPPAHPCRDLAVSTIDGWLDADAQAQGYARYFASGSYEARYPRPNRLTLARTLRLLPAPRDEPIDILDYGCGQGRYLVPLLRRRPDLRALAYDPCAQALATLDDRLGTLGLRGRVRLVSGDVDDVATAAARNGFELRLAVLLFGVLGHVQPPPERTRVLRGLAALLAPAGGRLALSVPNERRRFRSRARAAGDADIMYRRDLGDGSSVQLGYHLYRSGELLTELQAAGFAPIRIATESVASESAVTTSAWLGRLDAAVATWCPARWGYGLFAAAEVAR